MEDLLFSQLGPLFKTVFRKAEQSDARFEIRREEKEQHRKKEDETQETPDDIDLWADSTSVSIQALRSFLIDFLKSKGDDVPEEQIGLSQNAVPLPYTTHVLENPVAQKALKAYATMSSYGQAPVSSAPQESVSQNLSDLLAVDELRTMHVLIAELDILSGKGIQTLIIEKDESFLKALVMAVQKAKEAYSSQSL